MQLAIVYNNSHRWLRALGKMREHMIMQVMRRDCVIIGSETDLISLLIVGLCLEYCFGFLVLLKNFFVAYFLHPTDLFCSPQKVKVFAAFSIVVYCAD